VGHGNKRRQIERPAGPVEPCRFPLRHPTQRSLVADRAGKIRVAGGEIGIVLEHAGGGDRARPVRSAADVAGIDEAQPIEDRFGAVGGMRAPRDDEALQVRPRWETVLARETRLRIVQTQGQSHDRAIVLAGGSRQSCAKARDGAGVGVLVSRKQVFRLPLQMVEIGPLGEPLHGTSVHQAPTTRKLGCTKVCCDRLQRQWAQPFPRVRMRLAPQTKS
jgi:hypothetical protein